MERDDEQPAALTPEADRVVAQVLAGNTQAFADIERLYQQDVWRIAAALLRDRDATENLVQQVFVDAYFHLDQYARRTSGRGFRTWRNRLETRTAGRGTRQRDLPRALAERWAGPPAPGGWTPTSRLCAVVGNRCRRVTRARGFGTRRDSRSRRSRNSRGSHPKRCSG